MIIYFSGNGNSRHVAHDLGDKLEDRNVLEINRSLIDNPQIFIAEDERRVVWVVPVHAWGLPIVVGDFLARVRFSGKRCPHYLVVTCGDDTGYVDREWRKYIEQLGMEPRGAWHVIMPNTFITLPGFDVDKKEVECRKLEESRQRIHYIASAIAEEKEETDLFRGAMPHLKSGLLRWGFRRACMSPKGFFADDKCISCGVCVRACPLDNIVLDALGRPKWGRDCTLCLGCYNCCSQHAVQYGRATVNKGQYHFADESCIDSDK